ncbi:MAG TPA: hypothetical protein VFZ04_13070 [Longimicrobiales bacterium]
MSIVTPWWSRGLAWVLLAAALPLAGCGDSAEPLQPGSLEILAGIGQSTAAGTAVPIAPSVRLVTTGGQALPGAPVTFAASGGGVATPGQAVTNAQGVATLRSWTLPKRAGSHVITVSSPGVSPVVIEATATVGAAAKLGRAAPDAQNGTVASAVPAAPAVLVTDAQDNPVEGALVHFSPGGNGSVASAAAVSDASGIARSGGWTLGTQAGEQTLEARIADAPGVAPVIFVAEATAAAAARLAMVMEPSTTLGTGVPLQVQPVVEVQDAFGNRAPSVLPVTAALPQGSTQALAGTLTVLATEGVATFTDLTINGTGNVQVRFTAAGLAEAKSATFSVGSGAECPGPVRKLDFALGESHRHFTSATDAPFCFDFALGANAGQQYLVQIENMSMSGNSDTGIFPGMATSQTGMTIGVSTGAVPPSDATVSTPRVQLPQGAVHSWDFGGGQIFEIEPREPAGGVTPAFLRRGDLLLDANAGSPALVVGDTIVVHMVGIPRLGISDGTQQAVVRYTTPDLVIAEDVRLRTLVRQGGGTNTPLSASDMEAIATDYSRYAKVQADRFFSGRYNSAVEAGDGRPIAIHSLMYADNIWGYTFPSGNYFVWDFWVGTNGSVKGPNQQVERNSNNLFMHELTHMRHFGLTERTHGMWRANRWLVEGFARASERWPVAMRLLGSITPPRTDNLVLPLYPVSTLNMVEDVPAYTQASSSLYGGYAASSYVFDYFADQVARRGTDWTTALSQFIVNAGTEEALNQVIGRYLPGWDVGMLFTQARIALFTDDYAFGLPDWTQYHQFHLRASRTTTAPQLDPRNLWPKIKPGDSFADARSVLPGGAYGYIIDGTMATGSARVLFNLPRANYGVISITRIK